jgi:hypothetical protein
MPSPQPGQSQPLTPQGPDTQPPTTAPAFGAEQSAAAGGDTVALAAPNMLGNLLGAGRSLSFFYQRTQGSVFINGNGSTNLSNPNIADNNSPVPQDRVYFRYNYFNEAQSVVGDTGATVFDPSLGLSNNSQPRFRGITGTKFYDVNEFTFGGEKTYLDGRASIEVRIPFSNALASNLNLNVAQATHIGMDTDGDSDHSIIGTTPTPQNTFGNSDTEFGNMTVILKGLAYQSSRLAVSAGLGIGIPTAQDTHVRVTDFLGDFLDNDIEILRTREFHVSNDTWSLSPFIAVLATPNDRLFVQGFLQVQIPLNASTIEYSEVATINTEPAEVSLSPLSTSAKISDQTLLQTDIGMGYWLLRNPGNRWLSGFAPTFEAHYTTTLENADIVFLPLATKSANLAVVGPNGMPIAEPNPTVGNLRNRLDVVDLTVGGTFLFGDRTTVATGFAFPVTSGNNKTFNWEYLLQVNYYFGGPARSERFAPPGL